MDPTGPVEDGEQAAYASTEPLTIGIDARPAQEVRAGSGRVVRELLRALAARPDPHRYVLYARERWSEPLDERFRWRLVGLPDPLWHMRVARAASECDVFLSSNSFLTVLGAAVPAVPIVYDLVTFDRSLDTKLKSRITERLTLGAAVRRSAGLIAISQSTAAALVERFPAAEGKVTVAALGVSPALSPAAMPEAERAALPEPGFVLAVGTLEPRKNLPRLVAAYTDLPAELADRHPLVVTGALGWQTGETMAALRSLGRRCTLTGYVSDAALAELYRRCAVFCYPSLGEGFGLPVLEAMAAGAAVVTSNVSSLPEVGGDAVEYADPLDTGSIRDALVRVLGSEERRSELRAAGPRRAERFSWDETAARVLEALQAVARAR